MGSQGCFCGLVWLQSLELALVLFDWLLIYSYLNSLFVHTIFNFGVTYVLLWFTICLFFSFPASMVNKSSVLYIDARVCMHVCACVCVYIMHVPAFQLHLKMDVHVFFLHIPLPVSFLNPGKFAAVLLFLKIVPVGCLVASYLVPVTIIAIS